MKIDCYGMSNVGMKRFQNEDSYLINEEMNLYIVADGMGGHQGGEYASKLAVTTIEEVIRKLKFDPDITQISGVNTDGSTPAEHLRYAILEACRKIYQEALVNESLNGMGTTTVAAMFDSDQLYLANVGDSRAYLIRGDTVRQLTEDHSLVSEQVKAGIISLDDAKGHKLKNIITRSVGFQEEVDSDITVHPLQLHDKILLCSDGLSNFVEDAEIQKIVVHSSLRESCERLVNSANSRGGEDNITVVVLEVVEI